MTVLDNGTTFHERSCLDLGTSKYGKIGTSFDGSFCYEKQKPLSKTYIKVKDDVGRECIGTKNLCNTFTYRNDTDEVMLKLLENINENVLSMKNTSPSTCGQPISFGTILMLFGSIYAMKFI